MLAKIWKKVLLAICIIACIYNIMAKLVNRHSLEENLNSVNDGEVVFDFSKNEKVVSDTNTVNTTESENTISENVIENSVTDEVVENDGVKTSSDIEVPKGIFDFLF